MARLKKATQAFIEIPHLRFQNAQKDTIIIQKNKTIGIMAESVKVLYASNQELRGIIDEKEGKWKDCDTYSGTIEDQNRKLVFRDGFMKIGTPLIAVAVGAGGFIVGYYVAKALP